MIKAYGLISVEWTSEMQICGILEWPGPYSDNLVPPDLRIFHLRVGEDPRVTCPFPRLELVRFFLSGFVFAICDQYFCGKCEKMADKSHV